MRSVVSLSVWSRSSSSSIDSRDKSRSSMSTSSSQRPLSPNASNSLVHCPTLASFLSRFNVHRAKELSSPLVSPRSVDVSSSSLESLSSDVVTPSPELRDIVEPRRLSFRRKLLRSAGASIVSATANNFSITRSRGTV